MGTIGMLAVRSASKERQPATPEIAERAAKMHASILFTGLTRRECEEVAAYAQPRTYAGHETIYIEGQTARHLALIVSGSVKLSRLGASGFEVILWMAKPGDTIGVLADSVTRSHTCSACAMEPTEIYVWDFGRLQRFIEELPQIRENIGAILSIRLNELEERFREVATEKVERRVAHAILRLSTQVGKPAHGGVELALTREELVDPEKSCKLIYNQ